MSPLTFKMVLMTLMLALTKVYLSLLYAEWRIWMPKSVIECWLKCKTRNWIWFMRKCLFFRVHECILTLLVAVSRKRMRIFSLWTAKGVLLRSSLTLSINTLTVSIEHLSVRCTFKNFSYNHCQKCWVGYFFTSFFLSFSRPLPNVEENVNVCARNCSVISQHWIEGRGIFRKRETLFFED